MMRVKPMFSPANWHVNTASEAIAYRLSHRSTSFALDCTYQAFRSSSETRNPRVKATYFTRCKTTCLRTAA